MVAVGLGGPRVVGTDVSLVCGGEGAAVVFGGDGAAVSVFSGDDNVVGVKVSDCVGSSLTTLTDGAPVGTSWLPRGQAPFAGGSSRVKYVHPALWPSINRGKAPQSLVKVIMYTLMRASLRIFMPTMLI